MLDSFNATNLAVLQRYSISPKPWAVRLTVEEAFAGSSPDIVKTLLVASARELTDSVYSTSLAELHSKTKRAVLTRFFS
jgi:hypothetical protein